MTALEDLVQRVRDELVITVGHQAAIDPFVAKATAEHDALKQDLLHATGVVLPGTRELLNKARRERDALKAKTKTLLHLVSEANGAATDRLTQNHDLQRTVNRVAQENESIKKRFLALALTADCNLCRCTDCVPG